MDETFPLFKKPIEYLSIFRNNEKLLSELLYFTSCTHFTGNICLHKDDYKRGVSLLPHGTVKELENNFIFAGDRVFLRGHNYYLPGVRYTYKSKLERLFSNFIRLNDLVPECQKIIGEDIIKRMIFSSVFDHLKNYSMILFNGFYREYLRQKKINGDIRNLMEMCSRFINYYYSFITSNERKIIKHDDAIIRDIMQKTEGQDYSKLSYFYREMDHPSRILMQSSNITNLARTKYDVVVNPLSGAVELGFALMAVSMNVGMPKVCRILPVEYSGYKVIANQISNFSTFVEEAILPIYHNVVINATPNTPFLILDDSIGTGRTIDDLIEFFSEKYDNIHTAVIEAKTMNLPGDRNTFIPERQLQRLTYKPIGELRRGNIVKESISNLLEGKL